MFLEMALMAVVDAASPGDPETVVRAMGPAVVQLVARPEVTVVPYSVPGRNAQAIRRNMDRLRPSEPAGQRFDALTTWQFSTRWGGGQGRCDPQTSEARVGVLVQLPYLAEGERLRRGDRGRWDRYFTALVSHETHHAKLAIEGANQMQAEMRLAQSCDQLADIVDRRAEAILEATVHYDALTDHGRKEGAVFP